MATLSGQKVKDAFASLLKLASNTATTTLKNVESGDGVATALQIGTTKVGINGTLEFSTPPATGSTELDVLLLNGSDQVVTRTLNTSAFSGGALTTASLPLAVSGSDVRMANPSSLSDIGTPASGDRFLIYDASLTTWKRIDYSSLSALINPLVYQSAPELVARTAADLVLTASPQYLEFAGVATGPTDSTEVGAAADVYEIQNVYGGTNDAIRIAEDGVYQVTLGASISTGGGSGAQIKLYFDINGSTVNVNETPLGSGADHFVTQSTVVNLTSGDTLSVLAEETGSVSITLNKYSVFHLRKL